jgi:hypothetical protein
LASSLLLSPISISRFIAALSLVIVVPHAHLTAALAAFTRNWRFRRNRRGEGWSVRGRHERFSLVVKWMG